MENNAEPMEEYLKTYLIIKDIIQPRYNSTGDKINNFFNYQDVEALFNAYDGAANLARSIIDAYKRNNFVKEEVYFFFCENDSRDAYGGIQNNGLSIVGVSKGLFESIHKYLVKIIPKINLVLEKLNIKNFEEQMRMSLHAFLYGIIVEFLVIHEVGHIIQYEGKHATGSFTSENTTLSEVNPYNEDCHISELDTDQFAVRQIVKKLKGVFDSLDSEYQTTETLENMIAFTLLAIYSLFDILSDEMEPEIFVRKGDHPHQAVRIQAALNTFESTFNLFESEKYKIDKDRMLGKLSTLITHASGSAQTFINYLVPFQDEIKTYFDDLATKTKVLDWSLTKRAIG
jgi:hypothetical protein